MTLWILAALAVLVAICLVAGIAAVRRRHVVVACLLLGGALGFLARFVWWLR